MIIYSSLINVFISFLIFFVFNTYESFGFLFLSSFFIFCFNCYLRFNNFLFLFRNLTLGAVGYVPLLIKIIYGENTSFYFGEPELQIFDICLVMYFCTSIALFSSEIGLELGKIRFKTLPNFEKYDNGVIKATDNSWLLISVFSIPVIILVSYLTAISAGPPIWQAAYATEAGGQTLGNLQTIGIISLLAFYVGSNKCDLKNRNVILFLLIFIFLFWGMAIRGLRQDVITSLLGIVFCYGLIKGEDFKIKPLTLILIFFAYLIFETLGAARAILSISGVSLYEIFTTAFAFLSPVGFEDGFDLNNLNFFLLGDAQVVMPGTLGAIAKTFSTTVYLVDAGYLDLQYGKTYYEFILRSPPEFLYPNRPEDYAWMFLDFNTNTVGGFFELAEVYFNFGFIGMMFVPGLISFLISYCYTKARIDQSLIAYFLLFSFLGSLFRGAWYQTFAFYKSFLTSMILLILFIMAIYMIDFLRDRINTNNSK